MFSEEELLLRLDRGRLPKHVAIIMDGNGRWAKERNLPRVAGHKAGMDSVREVVKTCGELGIDILTLYVFSTENWRRPRREVNFLMRILREYLRKEVEELNRNKVKLRAMGRLGDLPEMAQEELKRAIAKLQGNDGLLLNLALNYGGRQEIVDAVRKCLEDVRGGNLSMERIDEGTFSNYLYTRDLPDPDLLIRTSGEWRLSNFLLWQLSYTEIWVTPIYWPDFRKVQLLEALIDYQQRERRFGDLERRR